MTALRTAIDAFTNVLPLDGALDVGSLPAPYTIDSENILVTVENSANPSVIRGQNGTSAASHAYGASLTAGWGGGGGAISATDGITTVNPATSIRFPGGITDGGAGLAVQTSWASYVHLYVGGSGIDISQAGRIDVPWDHAQDFTSNPLAALPPTLGITSPLDGSSALTVTETGIWGFQFYMNGFSADATLKFYMQGFGAPDVEYFINSDIEPMNALGKSGIFFIPSGSSIAGSFITTISATAPTYFTTPNLVIMRLG